MEPDNETKESTESTGDTPRSEKTCRICYEGEDAELGRLIKPCLCTGSISHVHVKCLQRWRTRSTTDTAFYRCPQCKFHYRFARTKVVGLATNSVAIGVFSSFLFTLLVMCSSYITTYFMNYIEEQPTFGSTYFFISPVDVAQDLMRAAIRILRDQDLLPVEDSLRSWPSSGVPIPMSALESPSLIRGFIRRFMLGLPMIGAGSLIHMLFSLPVLAPLQWVARWRANRRRRGSSMDVAAAVIVVLIIVGVIKALYKVYALARRLTERLLLYAENVILEVN